MRELEKDREPGCPARELHHSGEFTAVSPGPGQGRRSIIPGRGRGTGEREQE